MLLIDVYDKGNGTTATVKGFDYNYERLVLLFRNFRLRKGSNVRDVNIKPVRLIQVSIVSFKIDLYIGCFVVVKYRTAENQEMKEEIS